MPAATLLLKAIRNAVNNGADITWAPDYAEPGYSLSSPHGVFFANWNPKDFGENRTGHPYRPPTHTTESHIGQLLEKLSIDAEWSDEWATCEECGNAVRTSPNSYSWTPSFFLFHECELVCRDCILDSFLDEYEEALTNNPESAATFPVDWAARGWYRCHPPYETGFHPGQNADPEEVASRINRTKADFLFTIDSTGQFDTLWSLWIRPTARD